MTNTTKLSRKALRVYEFAHTTGKLANVRRANELLRDSIRKSGRADKQRRIYA